MQEAAELGAEEVEFAKDGRENGIGRQAPLACHSQEQLSVGETGRDLVPQGGGRDVDGHDGKKGAEQGDGHRLLAHLGDQPQVRLHTDHEEVHDAAEDADDAELLVALRLIDQILKLQVPAEHIRAYYDARLRQHRLDPSDAGRE